MSARRILTLVALGMTTAAIMPGAAFAQTHSWDTRARHSPVCHINPNAGRTALGGEPWSAGADVASISASRAVVSASATPGSKLLDPDLRELEELGFGSVVEGDEVQDLVAFTFDDGPKIETTPRVLAALEQYDVPATFFVVGWRIADDREYTRKNAALLRDILAQGHIIGNHTAHHKNLAESSIEVMRAEIDDNTRALTDMLGYRPHVFRPPYGAVTKRTREHLRREGLTEVRWGVDSLDFQLGSKRVLRKRAMQMILDKRGGVVLMHDTKEATAHNIAGILDDLEAENCRRLDSGEPTIIPVSIHYFIRERDGTPREVPAHVRERTERYRASLPERCAGREP